jgi:hypothetical protein
MKRPNPQKLVNDFNASVKVGDAVDFWEVIGMGVPERFVTENEAEVLGGHTAVVWLKGKRGCVALNHCTPVPAAAERELTTEAQADRDKFERTYDGGNCSCHLSAPCGSCVHPGNPRNQAEDESCWKGGAA